jgi:hypothetical protein
MKLPRTAAAAIVLAAAGIFSPSANASIVRLTDTQQQGQGLGSTTTALT